MTHGSPLVSAVYEGVVRHRRHTPHEHAFEYRIAQLYLDLDEVDRAFDGRWLWSVNRRNVAEFRRTDYLGPVDMSLADAVRERVRAATGTTPRGPIRLLTHVRYAGYVFNPVSFYFCHDRDGCLTAILMEVRNTPWRERFHYVLPVQGNLARPFSVGKAFHVSPFLPRDLEYRMSFSPVGERLAHYTKPCLACLLNNRSPCQGQQCKVGIDRLDRCNHIRRLPDIVGDRVVQRAMGFDVGQTGTGGAAEGIQRADLVKHQGGHLVG